LSEIKPSAHEAFEKLPPGGGLVAMHRWKARRLVGLDGMRAYAVLGVFAYHLTSAAPGGWAGVDVFFVLSGYLITDLLIREYRRSACFRRWPPFW
jgi:peptidoglycan/LPS O-acetylase OafA/YrhL